MKTTTLLPFTSVTTYDLKKNAQSKTFATPERAQDWIERSGSKIYNVYRIEKVNGTWRTDWELVAEDARPAGLVETIAKAALDATNFGLAQAMAKTFPDGCSLDSAREWAAALPWAVFNFQDGGEWSLYYLVASVGAGIHRTITGQLVKVEPHQATGMWSGCSLTPRFDSESAAREWARSSGLNVVR